MCAQRRTQKVLDEIQIWAARVFPEMWICSGPTLETVSNLHQQRWINSSSTLHKTKKSRKKVTLGPPSSNVSNGEGKINQTTHTHHNEQQELAGIACSNVSTGEGNQPDHSEQQELPVLDSLKFPPGLVPFVQLPEGEKNSSGLATTSQNLLIATNRSLHDP